MLSPDDMRRPRPTRVDPMVAGISPVWHGLERDVIATKYAFTTVPQNSWCRRAYDLNGLHFGVPAWGSR